MVRRSLPRAWKSRRVSRRHLAQSQAGAALLSERRALAEPSPRQLALIDELIAARLPLGWTVKDSFSMLDLESRGFRLLFDAEWIYSPVSRMKDIASARRSARWEIVRNDLA